MIYFTSDLHFHHDKIITSCGRPFGSGQEMNEALIRRWNDRVTAQDEVFILGDVTLKGKAMALEALWQLRGRKYLILGNHDGFAARLTEADSPFQWVRHYGVTEWGGARFVLFHYPILEWDGMHRGSFHLHGHQHNPPAYNLEQRARGVLRYDVGVDANGMAPVSAEEILTFFSQNQTNRQ